MLQPDMLHIYDMLSPLATSQQSQPIYLIRDLDASPLVSKHAWAPIIF